MIKILLGGSPCTFWSIANRKRETEANGDGWELFLNYVIAKLKFKPDFFLYENNKSISKKIKAEIEKALDCSLKTFNSNKISAQNRERIYGCNWECEEPNDRQIELSDVIDGECYGLFSDYNNSIRYDKSRCIGAGCGIQRSSTFQQVVTKPVKIKKIDKGGQRDKVYEITFEDGTKIIDSVLSYVRNLTPTECERLQTLPDGYTAGASNSQRYKAIGNGWTAEMIIYLLSAALKDIPKDEEIVVLSMYDGIGTGRYCLDKMGFTNVRYFAYEIDSHAKKIASNNYPDIIHCGNAFDVRKDNWTLCF